MKRIILVAVILSLCFTSLWSIPVKEPDENKGPCTCAIFDTKEAKEGVEPLIGKTYMNVVCNETGIKTCNELCTSLAQASKERATQALCQNLDHAENVIASLYTKTCDNKWQYAGITAEEPICCHDKKVNECIVTTTEP